VRLLAGDMLDDDEIVARLAAMRPQLEAVEALLAEPEQRALELPHRTRHLLLAQSLGRHLIAAYRTVDRPSRARARRRPHPPSARPLVAALARGRRAAVAGKALRTGVLDDRGLG